MDREQKRALRERFFALLDGLPEDADFSTGGVITNARLTAARGGSHAPQAKASEEPQGGVSDVQDVEVERQQGSRELPDVPGASRSDR
jgi:hypothetical protein